VLAGQKFGIPLYGTMAHSFIEAFDDEAAAFETFARARADNVVLLLDTYDTEAAARKSWRWRQSSRRPGFQFAAFVSTAAISSRSQRACATFSIGAAFVR